MNLFIAHTPYHIILSILIASRETAEKNTIVIVDDFNGAETFDLVMHRWKNNPFFKTLVLQGWSSSSRIEHLFKQRRKAEKIRRIVLAMNPSKLFVFNDLGQEAQAAIFYTKRSSDLSEVFYVEDGFAPYNDSHFVPRRSAIKRVLNRTFYGRFFEDLRYQGSHPLIDELLIVFPDIVIEDRYVGKRISSVHLEDLEAIIDESFLANLFEQYKFEPEVLLGVKAFFVLPHSSIARSWSSFQLVLSDILTSSTSEENKIAIKKHPRENDEFFLGAYSDCEVVIPKEIPSEFIYLWLKQHGLFPQLFGFASTALMTARKIIPQSKAFNIIVPEKVLAEASRIRFSKIGVHSIEIEDLSETIRNLVSI